MVERIDQLERLVRLRDQGGLTEAEFQREKAILFQDEKNDGPDASPDAATRTAVRKRAITLISALAAVAGLGAMLGYYYTHEYNENSDNIKENMKINSDSIKISGDRRISSFLRFDNIENCMPSDELKTFIDDMRSLEPATSPIKLKFSTNGPILDVQVRPATGNGNEDAIVASAIVEGVFEGLNVSELRTTRFSGSEIENFQIRFSENPERVRKKLNELGLDLTEVGVIQSFDLDDGNKLMMGVERVSDGASFLCSRL